MKRICLFFSLVLLGAVLFAQSSADELAKWKKLYDDGAITEAEYLVKKKEVLEGNYSEKNQSLASSSQNAAGSMELYAQIDKLIDDDFKDNKSQIASLSQGLTQMQRDQLYKKYEKSGVLPFVLNLIVGFGVGSFVQGDGGGGAFQCAFEGGGLLCLIIGAASIDSKKTNNSASYGLMTSGAIFMVSAAIYGLIRPWTYSSNYNKTLQGTLAGNPLAVNFAPIVDPFNRNYGVAAKISL